MWLDFCRIMLRICLALPPTHTFLVGLRYYFLFKYLDKSSQAQLSRGQRLVEVLKQNQYSPLSIEKQVIIVFAATNGYLDSLEVEDCGPFEQGLYPFLDTHNPSLAQDILKKKILDDDLKAQLEVVLDEYSKKFVAEKEVSSSSSTG